MFFLRQSCWEQVGAVPETDSGGFQLERRVEPVRLAPVLLPSDDPMSRSWISTTIDQTSPESWITYVHRGNEVLISEFYNKSGIPGLGKQLFIATFERLCSEWQLSGSTRVVIEASGYKKLPAAVVNRIRALKKPCLKALIPFNVPDNKLIECVFIWIGNNKLADYYTTLGFERNAEAEHDLYYIPLEASVSQLIKKLF
jgi:hypothetical protein